MRKDYYLSVMTFRREGRHERESGVVSQEHGGQRRGGRAAPGGDRGGVQQVRGRGERHHIPGEWGK